MHEKWAYTSQFHRVLHHFIFEKLESGPDSGLGSLSDTNQFCQCDNPMSGF